jgi:2,4-diketo-3-deoxy-L-fuconate hydrolase
MTVGPRFGLGMLRTADGALVAAAERGGAGHALADLLGPQAPATIAELVAAGDRWLDPIAEALEDGEAPTIAGTWAAPLMPPKLVCIGANYNAHNAEMLGELEQPFPYSFLKPPTTTVVGDGAHVPFPGYAERLDYEAELAVVVGPGGDVFGYAPFNDLSVRDWVPGPTILGMDWVMLKAFDGSAPFGPTITPARFVPDPQALSVRSWVNGEPRQDASTDDMTFPVARLVAHLRDVMTLEPGDVIATGTPAGVGAGFSPPRFLQAGDEVVVEVEGLGRLTTHIAPPDGATRGESRWVIGSTSTSPTSTR